MKVLLFAGAADADFVGPILSLLDQRRADVDVVIDDERLQGNESLAMSGGALQAWLRRRPAPVVPFSASSFLGSELVRTAEALRAGSPVPADGLGAHLPARLLGSSVVRRLVRPVLEWCERALPREPDADTFIRDARPDVFLMTQLTVPGSIKADCIRSARALGVPVVTLANGADAAAQAIARLDGTPPAVPRAAAPWWSGVMAPLLARTAARLASGQAARRVSAERRERNKLRREAERLDRRTAHAETKRRADEARAARRHEEALRREAARQAHEAAVDTAYVHYQRVRDWAARMRDGVPSMPDSFSDAERRMRDALSPLWQADRATVANLRRWSDPLNGAPTPDLGEPSVEFGERLYRQLTILRKQNGADILVPEPATLGACGAILAGHRHSEDTLTFSLAMAALHRGAVLSPLRTTASRRVVWEIGGGWGGFAYHFKTICPNVTYLITGQPERLLVSAVYLMGVMPGARCRLIGESDADPWADWEHTDFLFAAEGTVDGHPPPRLDLTADIGELVHMTPERVADHVRRAFEWGSPYVYSMLPVRAVGRPEAPWPVIDRWYWSHPVALRADESPAYAEVVSPEGNYAHLVGWRRLRR